MDSSFVGIHGCLGAALMILGLCVTFAGNNTFLNNLAPYGGSMYISESVVTLSGTNIFINNRSPEGLFNPLEDDKDDWLEGSGGAIYSRLSTLNINSEYTIFENNHAKDSGGALLVRYGNVLSKILGTAAISDNTTAVRKAEATVLHALPTSTEVAIDLNKPLNADTTTYN